MMSKTMTSMLPENLDLKIPFCYWILCSDDMDKYEIIKTISKGTYGDVFKAKNKQTEKVMALKEVHVQKMKKKAPHAYYPPELHEIRMLQLLDHENVVKLIEVCCTKLNKSTIYLVLDFCEHKLIDLISRAMVILSLGQIKKVMQQLLNSLRYIHSKEIVHLNINPGTILITSAGILKLAGFKMARTFSFNKSNQPNSYRRSPRMYLLYRPPEHLLGERKYGPPMDLWAAGCIMAEMWTRTPIMQAISEQGMLNSICHLCGPITPDVWPGVEKLHFYSIMKLPKNRERPKRDFLETYVKNPHAMDLLDKLFTLDPSKRIDAETSLNHEVFSMDPMPCDFLEELAKCNLSMWDPSFLETEFCGREEL